jgi:PPM family protein phosphatase
MIQPQASPTRLKIEFAQASDPGRDPNKQINEDSCGYQETRLGHLCVLCDGMGGHYGGREASQLAIRTIFELFEQAPPHMAPAAVLKAAIEEAGRRVYQIGGPPENRTRPGSTCVVVLLHDRGADVAHVGDSRAYIIRAGQIYPVTRDHSMVQGMIDAGLLTEEQAVGHPDGNKITRALGMKPEVEVEVRPEPMEVFPGDIFILASDGLTDMARNHEILGATRQALSSGTLEHACSTLVQFANDRGGYDNISVQLARVVEVPTKVSATIPQAPSGMTAGMPAQANASGGAAYGGPSAGGAPAAPPAGMNAPSASRPPLTETVAMTKPDTSPGAQQAYGGANAHHAHNVQAAQGAQQQAQPAGAWGVAPTAAEAPVTAAFAAPQGPSPTITGSTSPQPAAPPTAGPTVTEAMPAGENWSSQRAGGLQPPPASLSQYRLDGGPGGLPLPPPRPGRTLSGTHQVPVHTLQEAAGRPPGSHTPHYTSYPGARPSQGGIVFLIIGVSTVIAVLLIIVLWALLR